jgi:hypothetical protein
LGKIIFTRDEMKILGGGVRDSYEGYIPALAWELKEISTEKFGPYRDPN